MRSIIGVASARHGNPCLGQVRSLFSPININSRFDLRQQRNVFYPHDAGQFRTATVPTQHLRDNQFSSFDTATSGVLAGCGNSPNSFRFNETAPTSSQDSARMSYLTCPGEPLQRRQRPEGTIRWQPRDKGPIRSNPKTLVMNRWHGLLNIPHGGGQSVQ